MITKLNLICLMIFSGTICVNSGVSWNQKWSNTDHYSSSVSDSLPKDLIWLKYKSLFEKLGPFQDYIYQQRGNISSDHYLPDIGNGHLATQIGSPKLHLNGVYNGRGTKSHRAVIPSPIDWTIQPVHTSAGEIPSSWEHSLNAAAGIFISRAEFQHFTIEVYSYALVECEPLLVKEVHVVFNSSVDSVTLQLKQFNVYSSGDLSLSLHNQTDSIILQGVTTDPEYTQADRSSIYAIYDVLPSSFVINRTQPSRIFLSSVGQDAPTVESAYRKGSSKKHQLISEQVHAWMSVWSRSRVSIQSDFQLLNSVIHACQYYLLSSLPYDSSNASDSNKNLLYGLSPVGLAHGSLPDDYNGHVFWDMETWMYPSILLLNPSLARQMLDYRFAKLSGAKQNSLKYGFKGAKYPWESAKSGLETSPSEPCGREEIHINGDISFGVQQYLWTLSPKSQHAKSWYLNKGREILDEIATFWMSRVTYNSKSGIYEIHGVKPPDEYVDNVNNSAYTNAIASLALRGPLEMAQLFNGSIPSQYFLWANLSERIKIPFNKSNNIFPEYDNYKHGQKIKQADVILLAYPLEYPMTMDILRSNLEYYEQVTVDDGPAMTWTIFSILYSQIRDQNKAWQFFQRSYEYVVKPFLIWSEVPQGGGAVNFLTGMGGFMQSIINGYAGIRLRKGLLMIHPYLPPNTTELAVKGIHFQGAVLDFYIYSHCPMIEPISMTAPCLSISLVYGDDVNVLFSNQKVLLTPSSKSIDIIWQQTNITKA